MTEQQDQLLRYFECSDGRKYKGELKDNKIELGDVQ